ncbi:hypothetical protein SprV_0602189500 [Sparganum proliferum]
MPAVRSDSGYQDCRLYLEAKVDRRNIIRQPYYKSVQPMVSLPQEPVIYAGEILTFTINCPCCMRAEEIRRRAADIFYAKENRSTIGVPSGALVLRIISNNRKTVMPSRRPGVEPSVRQRYENAGDMSINHPACRSEPKCAIIFLEVPKADKNVTQSQSSRFWIDANTLGRSDVRVDLLWVNGTQTGSDGGGGGRGNLPEDVPSLTSISAAPSFSLKRRNEPPVNQHLSTLHIAPAMVKVYSLVEVDDNGSFAYNATAEWTNITRITVLLKEQVYYTIFDWFVYFVACLIAVSVGCVTEPQCFKAQLEAPAALIAGLVIQLLLLPSLVVGIIFACSVDTDMGYGLFVTTVIQCGGAAFIVTALSLDCDQQFAAVLAHATAVFNLVFAPLWVHTVGVYLFAQPILIERLIGLSSLIVLFQLFGVLLRWKKPSAAVAVLTWLSQPLLLLAGILLITLGVYINQYVFQYINKQLVAALVTTLTVAYALGWAVGLALRLETPRCRAFASHVSAFQGFLSIPILRMSVPSPEGELASTVALWMIFLMPIPFVYHAIIRLIQRAVQNLREERRKGLVKCRGPTAVLCADSLAAVAATAIIQPDLRTFNAGANSRNNNNSSNHNSKVEDIFLTVRSADALFVDRQSVCSGEENRRVGCGTKTHSKSVVAFREGMSEYEHERFLEYVGERRVQERRRNGRSRRVVTRHYAEEAALAATGSRVPPTYPIQPPPPKPRH